MESEKLIDDLDLEENDIEAINALANSVQEPNVPDAPDMKEPEEPEEDIPEEEPEPELEPEDPIAKRKIINKIQAYLTSSFADLLLGFKHIDLEVHSIKELNTILQEIQFTVGNRTNKTFYQQGFFAGLNLYEKIACNAGFEIQGLSNMLSKNQEVNLLVEELALKYQDKLNLSPEVKLTMTILISTKSLHDSCQQQKEISKMIDKPVSDTLKKKYEKL